MTNTKKIISISALVLAVIALVVLCAFLFFNNNDDIHSNEERIKVSYKPVDADLTLTTFEAAEKVISNRLENLKIDDFDIEFDDGLINIDFWCDEDVDPTAIIEKLITSTELEFRDESGTVLMDNSTIVSAEAKKNPEVEGEYMVVVNFDESGAKQFFNITQSNVGNSIMIFVDDKLISAPIVQEAISGGSASITSDFTEQEAELIASGICGKLPLEFEVETFDIVD